MKHVNPLLGNAPQKMRLKNKINKLVLRKKINNEEVCGNLGNKEKYNDNRQSII